MNFFFYIKDKSYIFLIEQVAAKFEKKRKDIQLYSIYFPLIS